MASSLSLPGQKVCFYTTGPYSSLEIYLKGIRTNVTVGCVSYIIKTYIIIQFLQNITHLEDLIYLNYMEFEIHIDSILTFIWDEVKSDILQIIFLFRMHQEIQFVQRYGYLT